MNLIQLRTEVLAKGFDPGVFTARIDQYLNDALALIARRVDYYIDEATSTFATVSGQSVYAWPAGLARMRSLNDTDRRVEMEYVSLRDIDRSGNSNGAPYYYALTGPNIQLYPTPDAPYNMEMRYWAMPAPLVDDNDTSTLPADWDHMLWVYATWMCYESEDDAQMGQYWQQRFNNELSMFTADQKFPDSDGPSQANGMWDGERSLAPANGWTLYGQGW